MADEEDEEKVPALGDVVKAWSFRRFGVRGLVALALIPVAFFLWTEWDKVKTWPGLAPIMTYLTREPLPVADPKRFSVVVAHLEDDVDQQHERLIVRLLQDFEGIQVLALDRTIPVKGPVPEEREREGHQVARDYLKESHASVLIWGSVLSYGRQTNPDLYLTAARGEPGKSKQYSPKVEGEFRLPKIFWSDLATVLRLLIATYDAEFQAAEGRYITDRLPPFIARIRVLLEARADPFGWDSAALASARVIFADALTTYGGQAGNNESLTEAVAAHRAALTEYTRERVPLDWARTQDGLGNALSRLGERESGTGRLEEAVAADRAALTEWTRERVPLWWAATQEQPRPRAVDAGGAGERDGAAGGSGGGLPRGADRIHARAGPAELGHDSEQPRPRAVDAGGADS